MNQYNAARAAGYSESYARTHNDRIEKATKGDILNCLEQAGLTEVYQAKELYKLTHANKVISCNIFVDKDGEMKKADGKSLDFVEVDDPSIRLRTWEHIANIKGQLKNQTVIDQSKHTHYQFEYKQLDENTIRASQSSNGSLEQLGKVEGSGSGPEIRKNNLGGTRIDEKGLEPPKS